MRVTILARCSFGLKLKSTLLIVWAAFEVAITFAQINILMVFVLISSCSRLNQFDSVTHNVYFLLNRRHVELTMFLKGK
jgi:hypothetical protein